MDRYDEFGGSRAGTDFQDYGMNRRARSGELYESGYELYEADWQGEDSQGPSWTGLVLGSALTVAGLYLIYRSFSGQGEGSQPRSRTKENKGVEVRESITIDKPASELYSYWRELTNLPQIMGHLKSVEDLGGGRSHWVAKGPLNTSVEWDAEITEDIPNTRLAWCSLEDAQVPNEGSVRFQEAPAGRGTEIHVHLKYQPPLGPLGAIVAKLFGEEPSQQIGQDLKRFKQRMETGEIATTEGQSSGRME